MAARVMCAAPITFYQSPVASAVRMGQAVVAWLGRDCLMADFVCHMQWQHVHGAGESDGLKEIKNAPATLWGLTEYSSNEVVRLKILQARSLTTTRQDEEIGKVCTVTVSFSSTISSARKETRTSLCSAKFCHVHLLRC